MTFYVNRIELSSLKTDCLIIGLSTDQKLTPGLKTLDTASLQLIKNTLKLGDFSGEEKQSLLLYQPENATAKRILLFGLGQPKKGDLTWLQNLFIALAQKIQALEIHDAVFYLEESLEKYFEPMLMCREFALQVDNTNYTFDLYKSEKKSKPKTKKWIWASRTDKLSACNQAVKEGQSIARAMKLCRDLVNQPPNICTPSYLAKIATDLAKKHKTLSVKILEAKQLKKENLNALLAVGQGSAHPPKLILLEYHGTKKSLAPIALIGKGITFDTGGISIKPRENMQHMRLDMAGASTVLSLLELAAIQELPLNIIGIIPVAENMPDGNAYRPGDIITTGQGLTVEVTNTDAEGRLILCDAIYYSRHYKPSEVIDMATLTGACIVALGHHYTALFSNHEALAKALENASKSSGDLLWRMPLHPYYTQQLKSQYADMINAPGLEAGCITAASFLAEFAKDLHWAHLDIAGTAYKNDVGPSGRPIPLLWTYLKTYATQTTKALNLGL
jgi:leucyl aminopeptidase